MVITSDLPVTVSSILQVVGVLAVFVIGLAALVLALKRKVAVQTIKELQDLAAVRLETILQERSQKEQALRENTLISQHLGECERLRNDFASHNLRLNARLTNYERCINSLERALGRPLTNFDDPFKDART